MKYVPPPVRRYAPLQPRRTLRPSDWGIGMTVCISAITIDNQVVAASDSMLTMAGGSFTSDGEASKSAMLAPDWSVLFAGDDIGSIPSLLRRVTVELKLSKANMFDSLPVQRMVEALKAAFQAE